MPSINQKVDIDVIFNIDYQELFENDIKRLNYEGNSITKEGI